MLQFSASGFVDTNGSPTPQTPPDGNTTSMCEAGGNFGIARIYGPCGALIGVFLNPFDPDPTTPPDELDFRGAARRVPTLRPSLQQPFYIGSGRLPSSSDYRNVVVPAGATRLFLGVLDHCCSYGYNSENTGSFAVTITEVPPPPPDPWPNVFAITNISLAGQPDGTNFPYGLDTAPLNSPLLVPGTLMPGRLHFSASGFVDINGNTNPQTTPDGNTSSACEAGGYFGIARISGPCGALIGLFLGPNPPNPANTPPDVDFSGEARNLPTLEPLQQQPFYVGRGLLPSSSNYRNIVVPFGATRLFLGVLDHCCSYGYNSENTGWFEVDITGFEVPGLNFDGDHKADISVFRPSTGEWFIRPSHTPESFWQIRWGVPTDVVVPADYDGDGRIDVAVWRPSQGTSEGIWYIVPSSAQPGSYQVRQWGVQTDRPYPADYDGDGKEDIAVWRPDSGIWYVLPTGSPGTYTSTQWGLATDIPVAADYDGDGRTDIAVWRPGMGVWYIMPSSKPGTYDSTQWGVSTDIPVPADYDGDGKTDIAVWRPSEGNWYILTTNSPGYTRTQWGVPTDIPVPFDYDGDGKTDIAVWRPGTGVWYILPSSSPGTYVGIRWGVPSDVPLSVITKILRCLP
jgi:hypothetical protein